MRGSVAFLAVVLVSAAVVEPALAQPSLPVADVGFGVLAQRDPRAGSEGWSGIYGTVTGHITPAISVVGELNRKSTSVPWSHFWDDDPGRPNALLAVHHWSMVGGVRFSHQSRLRPFGQVQVGFRRGSPDGCANSVGRACTSAQGRMQRTAAIVQPGGGVEWLLVPGLRLQGRVDLLVTLNPMSELRDVEHAPRRLWTFAFGPAFSFGKRQATARP